MQTFEATKGLKQRVRDMTGLTGDGAPLVTSAFAPGKIGQPKVAFNSLRTETELSEQKGLVNLIIGLYGTFRNPPGHARKVRWHVSEVDALDLLTGPGTSGSTPIDQGIALVVVVFPGFLVD